MTKHTCLVGIKKNHAFRNNRERLAALRNAKN